MPRSASPLQNCRSAHLHRSRAPFFGLQAAYSVQCMVKQSIMMLVNGLCAQASDNITPQAEHRRERQHMHAWTHWRRRVSVPE